MGKKKEERMRKERVQEKVIKGGKMFYATEG